MFLGVLLEPPINFLKHEKRRKTQKPSKLVCLHFFSLFARFRHRILSYTDLSSKRSGHSARVDARVWTLWTPMQFPTGLRRGRWGGVGWGDFQDLFDNKLKC
jgi:hypothetical protein